MPRKRFTPYNKPLAPVKPRECISRSEPVFSISMELYSSLTLTAEIREALIRADSIYIDDVDSGYDDTIDSIRCLSGYRCDGPLRSHRTHLSAAGKDRKRPSTVETLERGDPPGLC